MTSTLKNAAKDLNGRLQGEVSVEPAVRRAYARDGSMYQIEPQVVAFPAGTRDVSELVRFASSEGIPVHPRGAGSGRAGGAIGSGIVLDMSRHMRAMELDGVTAVVEPGVVHADLNEMLAAHGRLFGPDPSSGRFCTLGGMVGNNASGPHTLCYGATKDNLVELEVVLGDGSVVSSRNAPELRDAVARVLRDAEPAVTEETPQVEKRSTGYDLLGAWNGGDVDLTRLFCGSEGTLGIVTRCRLKTVQKPTSVATGAVFFDELADAVAAVTPLKGLPLTACELMDEVLLDLVRTHDPEAGSPVPERARAMLIVEAAGATPGDARSVLDSARAELEKQPGFVEMVTADSAAETAALWRVRKASSPILDGIPDTEVLHAVEDVCLPVSRLPEYVVGQKKIFAEHGLPAAFFGHVGNGNLHLDPYTDTRREDLDDVLTSMMNQSYEWVVACGGAISGEHGDGILRTPYVERQYPRLHRVFARIKETVDPGGLLNPGKIAASKHGRPDLASLRWHAAELAPEPAWVAVRHGYSTHS